MEQNNEQQKGITLDELATMIKAGFDGVGEEMGALRNEFKSDLKSEVGGLRSEIGSLRKVMHNEFEKVNLRLDNVAHRFELVELQDRVEVLEDKVGVKRK